MARFTAEQKESAKRFVKRAGHKTFLCDFVLNAYDGYRFKCDFRSAIRYAEDATTEFKMDFDTMVELVRKGVEPQELVGEAAIEELIEFYERRPAA
jgi:hypothetical protein